MKSPARIHSIVSTVCVVAVMTLTGSGCGKSVTSRGPSGTFSQETVDSGSGTSGTGGTGGTGTSSSQSQITCYQDQYQEPGTLGGPGSCGKVDMLFVVSSAASFDPYRLDVGNAIVNLIESLPSCVDYHFAVMLAHAQDQWSGTLYPGCEGPAVLQSDQLSSNLIGAYLKQRIITNPGESASDGGEAFTISMQNSLSPANLPQIQAAGFYRNDAALQVVTMSARNDICWTPQDYPGGSPPTNDPDYQLEQTERAQLCTGYSSSALTSALTQLKGTQSVTGATIAYTSSSVIPPGTEGMIGYTMSSLMNQINGFTVPLDQTAQYLANLAPLELPPMGSFTSLQTIFTLRTTSALLDPSTLTVSINGQSAPFVLDDSTMDLTISACTAGFGPGSVVDIDYCTIPTVTSAI